VLWEAEQADRARQSYSLILYDIIQDSNKNHILKWNRLLLGAQEATDTDRYRIILGELANVSDTAGQLQFRIRALEDARLVDKCEMLEEKEGRINSEALHHLIIKGKNLPILEKGDDLQQRLKTQVLLSILEEYSYGEVWSIQCEVG